MNEWRSLTRRPRARVDGDSGEVRGAWSVEAESFLRAACLSASVGPTLVARALAELRRQRPDVQIDLKLDEERDPLAEVKEDDADVAVVVRPDDKDRQGIRLMHLLDDPYHAVLPTEHPSPPAARSPSLDLSGEPRTGSQPPGPCFDVIVDACAAAFFSPNFAASSEDYAAGLGVGLTPRLGPERSASGRRRTEGPPRRAVRPIYAAVAMPR